MQSNIIKYAYLHKDIFDDQLIKDNILNRTIDLTAYRIQYNDETIKLFGYNVYQRNILNEGDAGVAIGVKRNIKHRVIDDFTDFLAVELYTDRGSFVLGTAYMPLRRSQFPYPDIMKIMRRNTPAYIIADLNARHRSLGQSNNNLMGSELINLIHRNIITQLGPDFNTFVSARGKGRPDIIIGNRNIHMNYAIQEGPLTTSDHIPIIFTLATSPVMIPQAKMYDYKRADWELFKRDIDQQMDQPTEELTVNKEYVDNKIDSWYAMLESAMNKAIPKKKYITLPHPLTSDHRKLLTWRYRNILEIKEHLGWTPLLRTQYKQLQEEMKEEIKRLKGSNRKETPYILNANNEKISDDQEKEEVFRRFWENVFEINDDDNRNFDMQHEAMVQEYLSNNRYRLLPYREAQAIKLSNDNPLTRPITTGDIKSIIKVFKDKAPGQSGVRKAIMQHLPDVAIVELKTIFNWALSMGYFPTKF
nr:uncharacterized protein LOC113829027 [Penaeus vannamei]